MDILTQKKCSHCGESKDASEFRERKYKNGEAYLYSLCKACSYEKSRSWFRLHPHKTKQYKKQWYEARGRSIYEKNKPEGGTVSYRKQQLWKNYRLTTDDYNKILKEQNGVCAICGGVNENGRPLFVDHDHNSGKIRGLLCGRCNSGIGYLKDDSKLVLKALLYLKGK